MKNRKSIVLLLLLLFVACNKDLEVKPRTTLLSSEAPSKPALILSGMYALLGSGGPSAGGLYGTNLQLFADLLAGENYVSWSGTFGQYRQVRNKNMVASNSIISATWRKAFIAINTANTLLELPNASDSIYKAHSYFVRGIIHFELVRLFARDYNIATANDEIGIPIILKSTADYESIKFESRATVAQVYTQILADLSKAEQLMPETNEDFLSKPALQAFIARVYLQMKDYSKALDYSNIAIGNSDISIIPLTQDFNTDAKGTRLFVIDQTQNNNTGTTNDGLTTFYGCDPEIPGSAGRGDVSINTAFRGRYETTDTRRSILIYDGTCNKASRRSGKWRDPYKNIPIIRLAEMHLTRAECNFRLGSSIGASPETDIALIRTRANATAIVGSVTLDGILNERELELAFEGHRIHDFRRTNKYYYTAFDDNDVPTDSSFYTEDKFVMPIPQVEINSNPSLVQNSYY